MQGATITLAVFGVATAAGLLGSLTGLGGGIILTPVLVLGLGVEVRYAVAASLVAVAASSVSAGARFLRAGTASLRVAVWLECGAAAGAVGGAFAARWIPAAAITALFGILMLWTAWASRRGPTKTPAPEPGGRWARLGLAGAARGERGPEAWAARRAGWGVLGMVGAGALSAVVGVGAGVVKVLVMDRLMGLPWRVSTATSSLMIGVTAAAGAGVYLGRGQVEPAIAAPAALGSMLGAGLGAALLPRVRVGVLRGIFAVLVALAGVRMLVRAGWGV